MNDGEMPRNPVQAIADAVGGKVGEVFDLPDGSGAATVSIPLPKHHWIYRIHPNIPPMPFRLGTNEFLMFAVHPKFGPEGGEGRAPITTIDKRGFERAIRAAGKYAIRCATMNGSDPDFDPDALLQNLVVGMLGYWTANAKSNEDWMNPEHPFEFEEES